MALTEPNPWGSLWADYSLLLPETVWLSSKSPFKKLLECCYNNEDNFHFTCLEAKMAPKIYIYIDIYLNIQSVLAVLNCFKKLSQKFKYFSIPCLHDHLRWKHWLNIFFPFHLSRWIGRVVNVFKSSYCSCIVICVLRSREKVGYFSMPCAVWAGFQIGWHWKHFWAEL